MDKNKQIISGIEISLDKMLKNKIEEIDILLKRVNDNVIELIKHDLKVDYHIEYDLAATPYIKHKIFIKIN